MDYSQLYKDFIAQFPDLTIKQNESLAPHTTLKIGGPADLFIHVTTTDQLISILNFIYQKSLPPPIILGNGSNVLISDEGLRGLVIKNTSSHIDILDTAPVPVDFHHTYTQRHEDEPDKYLDFTRLDYDESACPQALVTVASGTPLPATINRLLDSGITGLQWFAYIPGTVGGATWYNIHGGNYHFADYIDSVKVFDLSSSEIRDLKSDILDWKYEKSYFQSHPELIILSITLRLFKGDADMAKKVRDAWIAQKIKVQPMNSAGSAFANPSLIDCQKIWGEQKSTGWIIDHELNLKGTAIGGAQISEKHANFIVNNGGATAADYKALLDLVKSKAQEKFGLALIPEVRLLGEF